MATPTCVLGLEEGPEPPVELLWLGGAVLASLAAVTLSKWWRVAAQRNGAPGARIGSAAAGGKSSKAKTYPEYDIAEVKKHNTAEDAWVVVGKGVYDVTKWAKRHPGGERNIIDISGRWVGSTG